MRRAGLSSLALVLAACAAPLGSVELQTQEETSICPSARVAGVLVADDVYGLAFESDAGRHGVVWPNGYSARREQEGFVLIDPSGQVIAREGDQIVSMGSRGLEGDQEIAYPCGQLHVTPASANPG
jgi:hypothetical protein